MILAEFNFIGLFDNLGYCWGFPTNSFQVENLKSISCFDVGAALHILPRITYTVFYSDLSI